MFSREENDDEYVGEKKLCTLPADGTANNFVMRFENSNNILLLNTDYYPSYPTQHHTRHTTPSSGSNHTRNTQPTTPQYTRPTKPTEPSEPTKYTKPPHHMPGDRPPKEITDLDHLFLYFRDIPRKHLLELMNDTGMIRSYIH